MGRLITSATPFEVEPRRAVGFGPSGSGGALLGSQPHSLHSPVPSWPRSSPQAGPGQQQLVDVLEDGACSRFEQSDVRRRVVWTKIGRFKARTNAPSINADNGPEVRPRDQAPL